MTSSDYKILFVDDEQNLLDGIRRQLGRKYNLECANSGVEALRILAMSGPFAVVVSDMRMPGMEGVQLLKVVSQRFPDTVRIMLTGNTDLDTAVGAVNEGKIFRFINKPCQVEALESILVSALEQYRLIRAEKELLENTLMGSIKVLADVLSLTNPVAFGKTSRVTFIVKQIAQKLNLKNIWQYEAAAMLSQVGCVTLPPDTLEKAYSAHVITADEKSMYDNYPVIGHDLVKSIPRLEPVAEMIMRQLHDCDKENSKTPVAERDPVSIGAELLRLVLDFDALLSHGSTKEAAVATMKQGAGKVYNQLLFDQLIDVDLPMLGKKTFEASIYDLREGMILEEDIKNENGMLLVRKGHNIDISVKALLENHLKRSSIKNSILVSVATG